MTGRLDLPDIQGNILFAYKLPFARYFFFRIHNPVAGREFINEVRRKVTTAHAWQKASKGEFESPINKPAYTLNVAISWWGLVMLDLPTRTLREMPAEFINGMYKRRHIIGDVLYGENREEEMKTIMKWDVIWRRAVANKTEHASGAPVPASEVTPEVDPNFNSVHVLVTVNANIDRQKLADSGAFEPVPDLEEQTIWLGELCEKLGPPGEGVELLAGHGPNETNYQQANVLVMDGKPVAKEHFAFTDGIGDPVFEGQWAHQPDKGKRRVVGRGKLLPPKQAKGSVDGWTELATGEFLLGHVDESQELPESAGPPHLMRNGTFLVYRKLHQNAKAFNDYIDKQAGLYVRTMKLSHPNASQEANDTLRAKIAGRWPDGIPLINAPTWEAWQATRKIWLEKERLDDYPFKASLNNPGGFRSDPEYQKLLSDFKYGSDPDGVACPIGSHIRRANTRDDHDPWPTKVGGKPEPSSALNKRRRILRRGLPYGEYAPEKPDTEERGIIFLALCASIFRQFEFVQQQWINFGMEFDAGNDTCPIIGHRGSEKATGSPPVKFVIPSDPKAKKPPFICAEIPQFVETRGGDYFFMPSMSALRMIAAGTVDPT